MESKIIYSSEDEQPKKRTRKPLTDEQKEALRERLAKAREAKKAKREQKTPTSPTPTPTPTPEPEPMPEPEPASNEPLTKEPLTKPSLTRATKKVKVEAQPQASHLEPVVEPKPKRKYVRKPKAIITQALPTFSPF